MLQTAPAVNVMPRDESVARCLCCGRQARTVHGDVAFDAVPHARYSVQWTVDAADHPARIDLVIGDWSEHGTPDRRVLVSLALHRGSHGGFMFVDGSGRPPDVRTICRRALPRAEVVGTPIAEQAFTIIDALWQQDARIAAIDRC